MLPSVKRAFLRRLWLPVILSLVWVPFLFPGVFDFVRIIAALALFGFNAAIFRYAWHIHHEIEKWQSRESEPAAVEFNNLIVSDAVITVVHLGPPGTIPRNAQPEAKFFARFHSFPKKLIEGPQPLQAQLVRSKDIPKLVIFKDSASEYVALLAGFDDPVEWFSFPKNED